MPSTGGTFTCMGPMRSKSSLPHGAAGPQGGLVGHVPAEQPPQRGEAGQSGSRRSGREQSRSHQAAEGKALLLLDNAHQPLLAGEQPRHRILQGPSSRQTPSISAPNASARKAPC